MLFYAVRHGAAVSKHEDPERPLSGPGRSEVERVAATLKHLNLSVGVAYHSGKARARQTAEIMATAISPKKGVLQREGLDPEDDIRDIMLELSRTDDNIMVAGHNPFMTLLVNRLLGGDPNADMISFPTGGVACIERADRGRWRLLWFISPDLLPH